MLNYRKCWLALFFCAKAFGINITISSKHNSISIQVENAAFWEVDQFFWENLGFLFPNYYYSGSTIVIHQISETHYHYELIPPERAYARVSNVQGNYHCPICSKIFKYSGNIYDHIRLHYGINIHCSSCGKEYRHEQSFIRHRKDH